MLLRDVCKELQWPLIDKDDARDCLQRLPAEVRQTFDANQLSYDIMFSYCETQLQLGLSVVLDCPFARVSLYHRARELADKVRDQLGNCSCGIWATSHLTCRFHCAYAQAASGYCETGVSGFCMSVLSLVVDRRKCIRACCCPLC